MGFLRTDVYFENQFMLITVCGIKFFCLSGSLTINPIADFDTDAEASIFSQYRSQKVFIKAFTAKDIADPLRSFSGNDPSLEVLKLMQDMNSGVAGVQLKGMTAGYVIPADLENGDLCKKNMRRFRKSQMLESEASLTDVIHVLTRYEYCFVSICGSIFGVIDRSDIQKPVVRMWLFGIITLVEMIIVDRIRAVKPNGSWKELISKQGLKRR